MGVTWPELFPGKVNVAEHGGLERREAGNRGATPSLSTKVY